MSSKSLKIIFAVLLNWYVIYYIFLRKINFIFKNFRLVSILMVFLNKHLLNSKELKVFFEIKFLLYV
jgi:hypothetical protein